MKFGVREICNVVFKANQDVKIGATNFKKGQPVLYIDTAKTSTVEGAATTVYAQGGRGNTKLLAWEGEKTLTFTVEDALLSPIGFSILSGAGLLKGASEAEKVYAHMTTVAYLEVGTQEIDLSGALLTGEVIAPTNIFVIKMESDGSITGETLALDTAAPATGQKVKLAAPIAENGACTVMVDYYVMKNSANVSELQIDAERFAGYYYVEADTLFRTQGEGKDMPANLTFPKVKIQSNFTFNMASTGDPSTFTFTMDAFPGYTLFNPTKQVLCAIQILEDVTTTDEELKSVFGVAESAASVG